MPSCQTIARSLKACEDNPVRAEIKGNTCVGSGFVCTRCWVSGWICISFPDTFSTD